MPRLEWDGKKAVENYHLQVPYHVLREEPELSCGGEAGAGNLLVQGDNLVALKALLPYYRGQVKCIYIDPPYNTGNEGWVYNDNVNSPIIKDWLGKAVGKEAEDFSRHDKWLCMMYPRLKLLAQFLRQDGAIFISLDDNEISSLRLMLDEVFGGQNFVAHIIWEKRKSRENRRAFSFNHDFVLIYARNKQAFEEGRNLLPLSADVIARYKNPDADPRGPWQSISALAQAGHATASQFYTLTTPSGKKLNPPKGNCWRYTEKRMTEAIHEGRIWFGKTGENVPRIKRYLSENPDDGLTPETIWTAAEVSTNDEAKKDLIEMLPNSVVFDNPKPVPLIVRILQIATKPGDIIIDSFAGSGTTGHAVLKLNQQDKGKRHFIQVEMESKIAKDITAERLKRAAIGYVKIDASAVEGLGGGFRFLTLGEAIFNSDGTINPTITFPQLARHVWFEATREPLPATAVFDSPLLGVSRDGTAYYLLFNGILKDRSVSGGNILTRRLLASLPKHEGPKIIYAAGCRLKAAQLREEQITFRQTPYQIEGAAAVSDSSEETSP